MIAWGYYAQAARSTGVPEMWIDDAVQDIALKVWQAPDAPWKSVVYYAAVDAARQYGKHSKTHDWIDTIQLTPTAASYSHVEDVIDVIDFRRSLGMLRPREFDVLERRMRGQHLGSSDEQYLAEARRQLCFIRATGRTRRHHRTCRFCGKKIRANMPRRRYCDLHCKTLSWRGLTLADFERVCCTCGVPFCVVPRVSNRRQIHCSYECRHRAQVRAAMQRFRERNPEAAAATQRRYREKKQRARLGA